MTFEYVFVKEKGKHFLTFLLLAIMPALALSYIFPASQYITIFANYNTPYYANFGRLWLPIFSHPIWALLVFIFGLILLVIAISSINSIMMRHFRVNDFSLTRIFNSTDENFFSSLTISIALIILILFFHTFTCLFVVLWFSLKNSILGIILAILSVLCVLLITIYLCSAITLWLPIMTLNGIPIFRALQLSFSKAHSCQNKMFITNLFIALFCLIPTFLAWLFRDIWIIKLIFNSLVYITFITTLFPANLITYCDVEGITREDLIHSPYKRR